VEGVVVVVVVVEAVRRLPRNRKQLSEIYGCLPGVVDARSPGPTRVLLTISVVGLTVINKALAGSATTTFVL